ncbi:hypothetical protein C8K30_104103 [Promicromonospora sp. AC04]|uniref:hypothetical protein n=1 Tax=Promicromonospora sp. AC04 TaxID=2135723 RepID=UPI000D44E9D7|nr:hypothetical protein [Promicromonospora sp. AC04]PUB27656.1 hypothetical protein C8K30_104103 [Promicromonospora sp. AC04]
MLPEEEFQTVREGFGTDLSTGTKLIYMLEGAMDYGHSRSVYGLTPGDKLQFDGEGAHGPVALVELPIRFLSLIAFPDAIPVQTPIAAAGRRFM